MLPLPLALAHRTDVRAQSAIPLGALGVVVVAAATPCRHSRRSDFVHHTLIHENVSARRMQSSPPQSRHSICRDLGGGYRGGARPRGPPHHSIHAACANPSANSPSPDPGLPPSPRSVLQLAGVQCACQQRYQLQLPAVHRYPRRCCHDARLRRRAVVSSIFSTAPPRFLGLCEDYRLRFHYLHLHTAPIRPRLRHRICGLVDRLRPSCNLLRRATACRSGASRRSCRGRRRCELPQRPPMPRASADPLLRRLPRS